jgi:hypothetical protein
LQNGVGSTSYCICCVQPWGDKGCDTARALALPPDPERLRQAALAHQRAEADAWLARGEDGVIHVCGWHKPDCAAAIITAWDRKEA